jgi:hypothetical protein
MRMIIGSMFDIQSGTKRIRSIVHSFKYALMEGGIGIEVMPVIHVVICDTHRILYLFIGPVFGKFRPKLASKLGAYVSRDFFLTTEFACTYGSRMYCEIFVRVILRVIQLIPKTPMMGFVMGSWHGASLCRLIVHHICS